MSPVPSVRPFQSILCPVDFSAHSRAALVHAVEIARRTGGRLTVLYADDPLLDTAIGAAYDRQLSTKQTMRELRRFLDRVVEPAARQQLVVHIASVVGRPAQEILKAARKRGSDLIVMGTQGLGGAQKMFFGSTTEAVLRRTSAAVLAVPAKPARVTKGWPGRLVMGAIELGASDRQDARAIAELARAFETDLVLVNVIRPTAAPPWFAPQLRRHDRERLAAARTRLRRLAADSPDLTVTCRVVLGDPGEELPALADDVDAGLMVLSLRRGHGVFGKRQGSTTYRVLCGSVIPVLALPSAR